jgi:hypothetical protein
MMAGGLFFPLAISELNLWGFPQLQVAQYRLNPLLNKSIIPSGTQSLSTTLYHFNLSFLVS